MSTAQAVSERSSVSFKLASALDLLLQPWYARASFWLGSLGVGFALANSLEPPYRSAAELGLVLVLAALVGVSKTSTG